MTPIRYEIEPYVGAKPILFGMDQNSVEAVLGPPKIKSHNFKKQLSFDFDCVNIGFDDCGLVCHVGFVPGAEVYFDSYPVFSKETFDRLCKLDGNPKLVVGFVVLLSLGIAFTGFHDDDELQKAVSVFTQGTYDRLIPKMQEY